MTLDQLRVFVAVAERQHVTRAAEALHLTQSAVSAAISALEGRHATKLFHRVGRRIELSEAGSVFLDEARGVLRRAAAAELVLAEISGLKRGKVSIQASQTIAGYWLPGHLVRYRAAYPNIDIELTIGNTAQAAAAIIAGSAELGFVEGDIDEPALSNETIGQDELALVVGTSHPWACGEPPDRPDLKTTQWVLREPGSGTRAAFEAELVERGLSISELDVLLTLPSNEAVRSAVEAGRGATVMSMAVVAADIQVGRLVRIPFRLPTQEYRILRSKERYRSHAATALLDLIDDASSGTPQPLASRVRGRLSPATPVTVKRRIARMSPRGTPPARQGPFMDRLVAGNAGIGSGRVHHSGSLVGTVAIVTVHDPNVVVAEQRRSTPSQTKNGRRG